MKTNFLMAAFAAILSFFSANAQNVLMATLQHDTEMTPFYGADAVKDAVAAAQEGDVISISGGTFNAPTIDKPLTIQGAGYVQDVTNNRERTLLIGEMNITLPESDKTLLLEGLSLRDNTILYGHLKGVVIKHCLFNKDLNFSNIDNNTHENTYLLHNRIQNLKLYGRSINALIKNNIIQKLYGSKDTKETVLCLNNVIGEADPSVTAFTYKNNVIGSISEGSSEFNSYYNNLYSGTVYHTYLIELKIPSACAQDNNTYYRTSNYDGITVFFDNYKHDESFMTSQFHLKDEFSQYMGDDGTVVGIYGGTTPFSEYPSNPRITSSYVSPQADENNQISVRFTIETAQ